MNPCDFVMFGAASDLARRKLLPSLYQLEKAGLIDPDTRIIGAGREHLTSDSYIDLARKSLETFMKEAVDRDVWDRLVKRLHFVRVEMIQYDQYRHLCEVVNQQKRVMVNYFAVPPAIFGDICNGLEAAGLATENAQVVLEKPIGVDLASSRLINDAVAKVFNEEQVYRIDHYLGKETVLNLLALRFANSIFITNHLKEQPERNIKEQIHETSRS